MPTGSRRNTKNLTAAKMPPKVTKRTAERTAEPCPIQSGTIEERGRRSRARFNRTQKKKVNNGFFISQKLPKIK